MNLLSKTSAALVSALLLAGLAPRAAAQSVSLHYGKQTSNSEFGVHVSTGHGGGVALGYASRGRGSSHGVVLSGYGHKPAYNSPQYAPVSCPPPKVWVPGSYQIVQEQVWIPASKQKVWVEPVYATHYDSCGVPYRVLVCEGRWEIVHQPGHWDVQSKKVYQAGYWKIGY